MTQLKIFFSGHVYEKVRCSVGYIIYKYILLNLVKGRASLKGEIPARVLIVVIA